MVHQKGSYCVKILSMAILLFGCLLAACATSSTVPSTQSTSTPTSANSTSTPASGNLASTQPVPVTQTTCPAAGAARAEVTAPFLLGSHQNIVYVVNQGRIPGSSYLRRYDSTTQQKTDIVHFDQGKITNAHLSADDQWVLFVHNLSSGQDALQMVRVDGQGLQTFYCVPSSSDGNPMLFDLRWSPDQQLVAFMQGHDLSSATINLLNLTTGTIQVELQAATIGKVSGIPTAWLDNTHLYLTGFVPNSDAPPQNVYVLDTTKGAHQTMSNVSKIIDISGICFAFDTSYDRTQLYLSHCNGTLSMGGPVGILSQGPSTITVQPALGGTQHTVYTSPTLAIKALRVVSRDTILFVVGNTSGDASNDGLWKMNVDGSNATKLAGVSSTQSAILNTDPLYEWSNVSHDGTSYAFKVQGQSGTQSLAFGSLSGQTTTSLDSSSGDDSVDIVGWTAL